MADMPPLGTLAWTKAFIKSIQDDQQNMTSTTPNTGGGGGSAALARLAAVTPSTLNFNKANADYSTGPSTVQRIIDVISRPFYASANVANNLVKTVRDDPTAEDVQTAIGRGITGKEKTTYHDVVKTINPNLNPLASSALGLAGDLLLDPINFAGIPLSAGFKVAKGALTKSGRAEKAINNAMTEGRAAEAAVPTEKAVNDGRNIDLADRDNNLASVPDRPQSEVSVADQVMGGTDTPPVPVEPAAAISEAPRVGLVDDFGPSTPSGELTLIPNQGNISDRILGKINKADSEAEATVQGVNLAKEMPPTLSDNLLNKAPLGQAEQGERAGRLISATRQETYANGLKHDAQHEAMVDNVIPSLQAAETVDRMAGITHYINAESGTPKHNVAMSQIYTLMDDVARETETASILHRSQMSYRTAIAPSQVSAMAAKALDTIGMEPAKALRLIKQAGREDAGAKVFGAKLEQGRSPANLGATIDRTAKFLQENQNSLRRIEIANDAANVAESVSHGRAAGIEVNQIIDKQFDLAEGGSIEGATDVINDYKAYIRQHAGSDPIARDAAALTVGEHLGKIANPNDIRAAKTNAANVTTRQKEGFSSQAQQTINSRAAAQATADRVEAEKLLASYVDPVDAANEGMKISASIENGFRRKRGPSALLGAWGYGTGTIGTIWKSKKSYSVVLAEQFRKNLATLDKTYDTATISAAYKSIRTGTPLETGTNPLIAKVQAELRPMVDQAVSVSGMDPLSGQLFSNGHDITEINEALKVFSVKHEFEVPTKRGDPSFGDQWKSWEIADPLDHLNRMFSAVQYLNMRSSVGADFSSRFGLHSIPAAADKARNYARITVQEGDLITPYLDKTRHYPKEAIEQLKTLESVLKEARDFKAQKGTFAHFVNNVIDPVYSLWKPMMTIVRPGHHARNILGEIAFNLLAGVKTIGPYRKAAKMMKAGNRLNKDVDTNLSNLAKSVTAGEGHTLLTVTLKGGKKVKLDDANSYRLAYQQGMYPDYHISEDLIQSANHKGFSKISDAVMSTRYMQTMGKFAEDYSHGTRSAQFVHLMEDTKFTSKFDNIEDAGREAVELTRRTHPDTTGLSPFSQKYMRRLFPFYNWIRQATPIVLETMLTHPGRITQVPKGLYAIAEATGADPKSLSDPFPQDTLFPSFIRDGLGFVGGGLTINTGSPVEGVLGDMFSGNVGQNITGMLTPFIKAPIELATGKNLSTGGKIKDYSDYIDQQIPGVNQAANISGISPSGTVADWFTGGGLIDPGRSVQEGNKTVFWNMSLANFIGGLSFQKVDSDRYQQIANRERGRGLT